MSLQDASGYRNIASATTTTVKTGPGVLERITLNKAVASGVITVYDNTAGSGTTIATITSPATLLGSYANFEYGVTFNTGLTIVTSAADDITVAYK